MAKRNLFLLLLMAMFMLPSVRINAKPVEVPLEILDPSGDQNNPHKTPTIIPEVSIDGHTLYFNTPCDGYVLRLVDEFDNVVYSTVIPVGATSLVLPSYLSGTYELQIITGYYCFFGDITL